MKSEQKTKATPQASRRRLDQLVRRDMSDTPRTDAAEVDQSEFADWGIGPSGYVTVDFAKQLERELSESNALLLQARTMLDDAAHGRIELSTSDSSNPSHHDGAAPAPSVDGVVGSLNQEGT